MRSVHFLTDQEIFDRAVTHLYGQRRAALLPKGGAAYRGSCGGCPFGSFIRAADYASAMEGVPVRYLSGPALGRPSYMDAGIAARHCCEPGSTSTMTLPHQQDWARR
jgi:hypothetical protein